MRALCLLNQCLHSRQTCRRHHRIKDLLQELRNNSKVVLGCQASVQLCREDPLQAMLGAGCRHRNSLRHKASSNSHLLASVSNFLLNVVDIQGVAFRL